MLTADDEATDGPVRRQRDGEVRGDEGREAPRSISPAFPSVPVLSLRRSLADRSLGMG